MSPIIMSAAAVSPIVPLVKMYTGTPIATAVPKHISWRAVRLNIALFLILLRSLGTFTNAIISGKRKRGVLFIFSNIQTITRACHTRVLFINKYPHAFPFTSLFLRFLRHIMISVAGDALTESR